MKKLYQQTILILFLLASPILIYGQGNQLANFSFNPITPCSGTPTSFTADSTNLSGGFFTYYVWRIDNVVVNSGFGSQGRIFAQTLSAGFHDVQLTVTDSVLFISDDTVRTIYVDSLCNLSSISGTTYFDQNNNGIKDPGELGINNSLIKLVSNNVSYFTSSGSNGVYSLQVSPGQYDVSIEVPSVYSVTEPSPSSTYQVNIASVGSTSPNNDFGIFTDSVVKDLSILMSNTPLRPGFNGQIFVNVRNKGTFPDSGNVIIYLDTLTPVISSVPSADSIIGNTAYYSLSSSQPNVLRYIRINTKIDSTVQLGTAFNLSAFVFPVIGDANPQDNFDTLSGNVVGSYDPNDKLVFPNDDSTNAFERGTTLTYTIRFQNTGTFFAQNVRLVDQIEPNLDLSTLEMVGASHSYSYQINDNNRRVVWRFDDILLPAEQNNEPESHGFVKFKIDVDSGLDLGDTVYNSAEIYFDFNLPIITNTIVSTLDSFVTTTAIEREFESNEELVTLYPNPFRDNIQFLNRKGSSLQIELYTIEGERIITEMIKENQTLNLEELKSGLYLYKIQTKSGEIQRGKLIKK